MRAACGTFGGHHRVATLERSRLVGHLELELALEHERDLLLRVPVERRLGVRLEADEVRHHAVADDRLEAQPLHELERLEGIPAHPRSCAAGCLALTAREVALRLAHRATLSERAAPRSGGPRCRATLPARPP